MACIKRKKKRKKASVSIYVAFATVSIIIVLVAAVLAPMGVLFTAEAYAAGEEIMLDANESISQIQNTTIRNSIQAGINSGLEAAEMNIEVNSDIFQYSWVFVIALAAVVTFLYTRSLVEFQRPGGGFV